MTSDINRQTTNRRFMRATPFFSGECIGGPTGRHRRTLRIRRDDDFRHGPALTSAAAAAMLLDYQRAPDAKTSRPVYDPALEGRDDRQTGRRRDDRRDVRHRPASRPRAQSRRLFHQAGTGRALTTARLFTASDASASSRAAIRCRRIRRRRNRTAPAGSVFSRRRRAARSTRAAPCRPSCSRGSLTAGARSSSSA